MSNDKRNLSDQDYLLAEVVVKVAALERLLIKAGIATSEDIIKEMEKISQEVVSFMTTFNMKAADTKAVNQPQPDADKEKN
jgi:hypothetical protein